MLVISQASRACTRTRIWRCDFGSFLRWRCARRLRRAGAAVARKARFHLARIHGVSYSTPSSGTSSHNRSSRAIRGNCSHLGHARSPSSPPEFYPIHTDRTPRYWPVRGQRRVAVRARSFSSPYPATWRRCEERYCSASRVGPAPLRQERGIHAGRRRRAPASLTRSVAHNSQSTAKHNWACCDS